MAKPVITSLADLRFDIAGNLPVDLLKQWWESPRNSQAHTQLLEPFRREGVVVSSDASGLSKLSNNRSLLEVMKLVHQPKEVIFRHGSHIGGKSVGVWAADNTQMFYDSEISTDRIMENLVAVQRDLKDSELKIGIAAHHGVFWEIGGGMYGDDAVLVEKIAEDETEGGEILVTDSLRLKLESRWHENLKQRTLAEVNHPAFNFQGNHTEHATAPHFLDLKLANPYYGLPFSRDFYHFLVESDLTDEMHPTHLKYYSHRAILVLKIYHGGQELLLDELSDMVIADGLVKQVAGSFLVEVIKSNGDLAIIAADQVATMLEFAEKLYEVLRKNEYQFSIGVAKDDLYVFPLEEGGRDLAGSPVNLASKISEDIADVNSLYIHESLEHPKLSGTKYEPFTLEKSGVMIHGKRLIV